MIRSTEKKEFFYDMTNLEIMQIIASDPSEILPG